MKSNNENRRGGYNSDAGRDGKSFDKKGYKSVFKGGKPDGNRNRTDERKPYSDVRKNEERPSFGEKRSFEKKWTPRGEESRPRNDSRRFGEDRPRQNDDRPRFGDNKPRFGDDRPRFGENRPRSNDDRPRFGDNKPRFGDDRPRFGENRPRSNDDRPRFGDNKPRFGDDRPRYGDNKPRFGSDRPKFGDRQRNDDDRPRGEKLSFRKANEVENKFVETRFDSRHEGTAFRPRKRSEDYDPNAKYSKKKQFEHKQQHFDPTKPIRLNKFLANAGISSRREADEFIQAGVISVNGEIVSELGTKVLPTDKVMFHNQPVKIEQKIYLLLNKPKDYVTTVEDTHDRKTVMDIVKNACSERIYPVGRLDRNTTGVLLLTNDGDLATKLTHPKYDKKKIYHLVLDRDLEKEDFEKVLQGIDLGDFHIKADALEFVKEDNLKELGIEIHSGQNRVVRRIFDSLGYKILRLDRVYFAGLTKKNLPRGKYRFLTEREVNILKMGAHE